MTDRENTVKGQGENLLFRRLEKEDAPAAAALEKSCLTEAWSLSAWEAGLTDPNAFYAGAFLDGKLVGCCGIWQSFEDADVCNVAVDPSLRRRRIGERLLLFLMEEGRGTVHAGGAQLEYGGSFPVYKAWLRAGGRAQGLLRKSP